VRVHPCVMIVLLAASMAVPYSLLNNLSPVLASPATAPSSGGAVLAATRSAQNSVGNSPQTSAANLDKVYRDESHCLALPDMRGDRDVGISCYCRDAIVEARYVYFTHILSGGDQNLNGVFLVLKGQILEQCGKTYDLGVAERQNWKWDGPEVVRTYPPDDVISRIRPETRGGKPVGRWVPFTVQLVYRDDQGRVKRTENYSSREWRQP
jgi:hypothetical protein